LVLHLGKEILRPIRGYIFCSAVPTVCVFDTTLWATNNKSLRDSIVRKKVLISNVANVLKGQDSTAQVGGELASRRPGSANINLESCKDGILNLKTTRT
jgi:hypothetical protein